jgi:hypothetical protein
MSVKVFHFNHFRLAVDLLSSMLVEMLRIRKKANGEVVFAISGRIDEGSIAQLEALIGAEGKDRRIVLDLKDMTLTGQDGVVFLARCEADGIELANCDPYVREWITRQVTGS